MAAVSEKTRIDKWLWAVRLVKTRSLATDACSGGKVKVNGINAKASQLVRPGDLIFCKKEHINYELKVVSIIEKRVGAPIAITCYENLTPPEELNKFENWFVGKVNNEHRERGAGRPTKRERREIDEYKVNLFDEEGDDGASIDAGDSAL